MRRLAGSTGLELLRRESRRRVLRRRWETLVRWICTLLVGRSHASVRLRIGILLVRSTIIKGLLSSWVLGLTLENHGC